MNIERKSLYWEDSFEIVLNLREQYPNVNLDDVGLEQLSNWIVGLANFVDDPILVNDQILREILRDWYEESEA